MAKIAEIMEKVRFTSRKDATVGELIRQLADGQIGWIPIVDDDKKLLAYITDGDIVRYISHKRPRFFDYGELIAIDIDDEPFESKIRGLLEIPVMKIAGKNQKISADVNQEIGEVADLFRHEHVRQIAVLDGGRVVGVVRESDIVRHILVTLLPETAR
ncbi:MAG: CBS domain-containing protein [Clostridiales Family XIII bacterium]|jgi:CBS domain-containing protein|nr:CBS domain-containing protein [Clostridiales Family XIII bacterium]